jgi:hypothetical protein
MNFPPHTPTAISRHSLLHRALAALLKHSVILLLVIGSGVIEMKEKTGKASKTDDSSLKQGPESPRPPGKPKRAFKAPPVLEQLDVIGAVNKVDLQRSAINSRSTRLPNRLS